jgi:hypothetical protein
MDSSSGVASVISLVLAIVLLISPATSAFSFSACGSAAADPVAGVPGLPDNSAQSPAQSIDESFNGKTVRVADGEILGVQLNERDPDQTWQFGGGEGFKVVSDVVLQTYPARHDFRVRVYRPGDIRFTKIDRRDGFVIDTFHVRVVIDRAESGNNSRRSHPLRMLLSMEPKTDVYPFWR